MRQRTSIAVVQYTLTVVAGWMTLLALVYVVERPLLMLAARGLDASWFPTLRLMLQCGVLATAGWVVGKLQRKRPLAAALVLAITLGVRDFGGPLGIDVPWMLRLIVDSAQDSRYLGSLIEVVSMHLFLFGSLITGAMLSRARRTAPLSIRHP